MRKRDFPLELKKGVEERWSISYVLYLILSELDNDSWISLLYIWFQALHS